MSIGYIRSTEGEPLYIPMMVNEDQPGLYNTGKGMGTEMYIPNVS